jgi:two-component system, cell cycle sensor histidine kinase and response regulator CckA
VLAKIFRTYGLAVVAAVSSIALTRLAWPFLAPTPYAPAFGAVAIATHWGSGSAGLLAIALAAAGAFLSFPTSGVYPWRPYSVIAFVLVSFIGNRLIAGRNRAAAALRESEAQLRVTLEEVRASGEALRRAQRMEAVGQLAARIAHSFNNLLTVTMVYVDLLRVSPADEHVQQKAIGEIWKVTDRGAALTRQMLVLAGKHDRQTSSVPVEQGIDTLRDVLRRLVREDVRLTFDLDAGPASVLIDPHDLEQIVLNLVMNARDALSAGGAIHVSLARETIATGDPRLGDEAAAGEYVHLCVRDNGDGLSAEAQAHLFEPFFSSKGPEGTGIGLAFVSEIARHSGGFVSVATAPGEGTSVSVYLPTTQAAAEASGEVASGSAGVHHRAAMILLVEDEDSVREATAWVLRRAGHRVLPAASPVEALALFQMYWREINLLITDIVMPDMPGWALANELLAKRPDLPVLFVSAHPDARPPRDTEARLTGFLAKPFSATKLLAAIAELDPNLS